MAATLRRKSSQPVRTAKSRTGTFTTKLVRIGNSRGVRLPKALIEQAGLADEVELSVTAEGLVLAPVAKRRAGWAESIKAAVAKHGHDVDEAFLALPNEFDEKEWTWPTTNTKSTSSRSTQRSARK